MAVRQTQLQELRYLKRQNLEEESRILGNYYRDLIRSFGVECNYYKLNMSEFENFNGIVDQNTVLLRAYGYNNESHYDVSAQMLVYAEAEQDIFQLNKFGLQPQTDVNLFFDSTDFACALAPCIGQLKEYPICEMDVIRELPDVVSGYVDTDGGRMYLSSHTFPYNLGFGYDEMYQCDVLSGRFQAQIDGYEYDREYTVQCIPYEDTIFGVRFPANGDLYRSLKYSIETNDSVETLIMLTYKVRKVLDAGGRHKNVLYGRIHGGVLFYDITQVGKYIEKIHPMVGDLVTLDFPDENNREKYEITECYDKQLTQDGINPLLHKYIWKCKARKYVSSYDELPERQEGDDRLQESHDMNRTIDSQVTETVQQYDQLSAMDGSVNGVSEDRVYGGYGGVIDGYDRERIENTVHQSYAYVDDGSAADIMRFSSGSRLVTDGYDLIFVNPNGDACNITLTKPDGNRFGVYFEENMQYIKATDTALFFQNINGEVQKIVQDRNANDAELEICRNSIFQSTVRTTPDRNEQYGNFYTFNNTRTYLFTVDDHLFCSLASGQVQLIV